MMRHMTWLGALVAVSLLGITAQAAPANLSGDWKLNLAKSNFGSFPAPLSINRKITQDGVKLAMTIVQNGAQGEVTSQLAYTTDGKPANKVAGRGIQGLRAMDRR